MPYNPKSLQNLQGPWTSETARTAQKNSVASRKANKEAREKLQVTAAELKLDVEEVLNKHDISSIGVLKIAMLKAVQEDDLDTAVDIAKTLSEFEQPKLARKESIVTEVHADELSDDELERRLEEIMSKSKADG